MLIALANQQKLDLGNFPIREFDTQSFGLMFAT